MNILWNVYCDKSLSTLFILLPLFYYTDSNGFYNVLNRLVLKGQWFYLALRPWVDNGSIFSCWPAQSSGHSLRPSGSADRAVWAPAMQPYLPPPLPQAECWEVVDSGPWRGVTSAPEGVCKNSAVEVLSDSWLSYGLSSHPAVASLLIASLCSPCTTTTGLFNIQALEFNYSQSPPLFRITWHTSALLVWPGFYKTTDVPILIIHAMVITWWLQM